MPRRIGTRRKRPFAPRRLPTFIRQWREHRGLTQEQLASRLNMSAAQLSRVENGKSPYTQDLLEMIAEALSTDVASLLIRDPSDPEGIWSIWDQAKPIQRLTIIEHAKITLKTGT